MNLITSSTTSAALLLATAIAFHRVTAQARDAGVPDAAGNRALTLPFGPWRLPDSLFHAPYSGTVLALDPEDATQRLDAARRAHMRVFVILERSRRRHQNPDHSFSLALWKREIDQFHRVDFAPYVADGTVLGHLMIDEPHDPTNWNGSPVPYATIDSAAAYSKALWPSLPAGVTSPPIFLETASWHSLDWGFAQYRPNKGNLADWLKRQGDAARRSGLGLVVSINALDGNGRGRPLTAAQLRDIGVYLAAEPAACALTIWRYDAKDPSFFQQRDVDVAARAIARVAASRPPASCRHR